MLNTNDPTVARIIEIQQTRLANRRSCSARVMGISIADDGRHDIISVRPYSVRSSENLIRLNPLLYGGQSDRHETVRVNASVYR